MKLAILRLAPLLMLTLAVDARACGHRCHCGRARHRVAISAPMTYPPPVAGPVAVAPPPAPAAPPMAYAAPAAAAVPAPAAAVQPAYVYRANSGDYQAYYYTYNDNGDLVIRQWMDWLFRGGRQAGLPAPPMPINRPPRRELIRRQARSWAMASTRPGLRRGDPGRSALLGQGMRLRDGGRPCVDPP